jgi:carboxyl-terminal processing protease
MTTAPTTTPTPRRRWLQYACALMVVLLNYGIYAMGMASFILISLSSVGHFATGAEPSGGVDGEVVRRATRLLLEKHLRQHIDPRGLSHAWARQFMLTLDPLRMHFLASDADEFMKQSPLILEKAQTGQVDFAVLVAERFLTRLDANASLISRLLAGKHDFTIDECVPLEYAEYAAERIDCDERWRLRIKYELLLENPTDPGSSGSREFLRSRYSRIQNHFDSVSQSKILSLYIDSLARSLDPHSAYFDEQYLTAWRISHIPNYTLGLRLAYHHGDLWILPSARDCEYGGQSLAGCRIVAVRLEGQKPIHLSGLTDDTAIRTITSPIGELGGAKNVILELDDPRRGKRVSLDSDRWLPGR